MHWGIRLPRNGLQQGPEGSLLSASRTPKQPESVGAQAWAGPAPDRGQRPRLTSCQLTAHALEQELKGGGGGGSSVGSVMTLPLKRETQLMPTAPEMSERGHCRDKATRAKEIPKEQRGAGEE